MDEVVEGGSSDDYLRRVMEIVVCLKERRDRKKEKVEVLSSDERPVLDLSARFYNQASNE